MIRFRLHWKIITGILVLLVLVLIQYIKFEKYEEGSIFPFRLLCNEKREIIPVVALTAFFRTDKDVQRYNDYIANGNVVVGYTSYKTFPKQITDGTGDADTSIDFSYIDKIKNWVSCFKNPEEFGFTDSNTLLEMSESDFKDADEKVPTVEKKYDFIYSCLDDDANTCPLNGWNAVNRNFDLAKKCFPIMINEFKLKILVMGRQHCGLEELYGDRIEVIGMLPYHEFQKKLDQSKYLFVPNIYDASPRVITEAISKDIPVLMNRNIICGSKYINNETGEFFTDDYDLRFHLKALLERKMSPNAWWKQNYSRQQAGVKFRNFLASVYPDVPMIQTSKEVYFK